jgi:hypothetical protein
MAAAAFPGAVSGDPTISPDNIYYFIIYVYVGT